MAFSHQLKVQVWIYYKKPDGKWLFLVLRTQPERGGFWQPVTGSVEEGESVELAALREAREETGLVYLAAPRPLGSPFEFESRGRRVKEYGFSLEAPGSGPSLPLIQIDPHEHDECRWVTSDQALAMIAYPSNAQVLH